MLLKKNKKVSITILLLIFVFVSSVGLFTPNKAEAIPVEDVLGAPIKLANFIWEKLQFILGKTLTKIGAVAFMRTYQVFMEKVAYSAATKIAEGAPGMKALWQTDTWEVFLKEAGDAAAAEFLDDMADLVGIDICEPPSGIDFKLNLQVGLGKTIRPGKPRCTLNEIKKKWGELGEKLSEDPLSLIRLNKTSLDKLGIGKGRTAEEARAQLLKKIVSTDESDLGFAMRAKAKLEEHQAKAKLEAELDRKEPDKEEPERWSITRQVKSPSMATYEEFKRLEMTPTEMAKVQSGEIGEDILNVFFSTLIHKSFQNMISSFFKPKPPEIPKDQEDDDHIIPPWEPEESIVEKTFTAISKIAYNLGAGNIDVISEMEMPLDDRMTNKINNGVIDSNFAQALREAQSGYPLTLQEAIDRNLIDKTKLFGFKYPGADNEDEPDIGEGFSYNSMKILRKNRVIPVGWEMAALKIKELGAQICSRSSRGCTLKDVMDLYDESGYYYIDGNKEKNKYCGLRPISADPYFITMADDGGGGTMDIADRESCENPDNDDDLTNNVYYNDNNNEITGLESEWYGSTDNIPGHCYKYEDNNEDGIIDNVIDAISDEGLEVSDQDGCEGGFLETQPTETYYYEWEPGGCMVIEQDESPLCHLVDPNWVLKAPAQKCDAQGYYSSLETPESFNRYQDCADVKHCIKEDDNGGCISDDAYNYCTKEKNIWRFKGNECNKQYNGCLTLKDNEGTKQSYLIDTLKDCPQTQIGCRDYIVEKEKIDGYYEWEINADKMYFSGNIEDCDSQNEGCSEFIEIKPGVNLIPNGSFEINEESEDIPGFDIPDGWEWDNNFELTDEEFEGKHRSYFIKHSTGANNSFWINFKTPYKGLYTLSYSAIASANSNSVVPEIIFFFADGENSGPISNDDANLVNPDIFTWQRKSGYFSVIDEFNNPNKKDIDYVELRFNVEGDVYIDAIQFELNKFVDSDINESEGSPSSYKEYGSSSELYFNRAPDYYECQSDNPSDYCDYFVQYCTFEDAGCEAYYPTNGDPMVPSVINDEDRCVKECNNYQTFVEMPSYFDDLEAIEDNGEEAESIDKNFIPRTAKNCSEPSCELFTNIDKLEKGAESKEYYSKVRQCVKPEEVDIKLYYTWEGSDTSAFQLKTWKLLANDDIEDPFPIGDPVGGYAPCTNVEIGGRTCIDFYIDEDNTNIENCVPQTNLDCRTFYDENAIPHNRLLSKTIPITEECIKIRRELSSKIYKVAPSMSRTCSGANVGCLEYKGNNSNNIRNVFIEDFEQGSIYGWMAGTDTDSVNLYISSEAVQYNGESMKVWVGDDKDEIWLSYNLTEDDKRIISGRQYVLSFWAKAFHDDSSGSGSINEYTEGADEIPLSFEQDILVAQTDWLLYKYDIIEINEDIQDNNVILRFKIKIHNYNAAAYDGFYIDNIILKEITNNFYKIKDSWDTPQICLDNNYLGCQEYQDRDGKFWYLYRFSDLCPEENIGCTAMINTQNSSMPFQQTFNAYCNDENNGECSLGKHYDRNYFNVHSGNTVDSTVIIPEDRLVYIVNDDSYNCLLNDKGCQAMAVIDNEGEEQEFYKINDPDEYDSILCLEDYKNCTAFSKLNGTGNLYKIHPRNLVCEYKDKDGVMDFYTRYDSDEYGIDTDTPCSGLLYNTNYDDFISNITEEWKPFSSYSGNYAALCPEEENGCSGFIDPLDNENLVDYRYSVYKEVLNYYHPSEWKQAVWVKDADGSPEGEFSNFDSEGISQHDGKLRVVLTQGHDSLIYRGPDYSTNFFDFDVESEDIYRLSARVKFDDVESIRTFLSCKLGYGVSDGYLYEANDNQIPYAFPAMKSKYSAEPDEDLEWQYIYGLYKILPGAQYCNIAFHIHGDVGSGIILDDIVLEKIQGDYYYLDNDSLDYESCNSPSLKDGCVLFHNMTESSLNWNNQKSYNEKSLFPGTGEYPSDVNALLKVIRDRDCAEWVACSASFKTLNPRTGQEESSCISLVGCDELYSENPSVCSHPFRQGVYARPLTFDYYQKMKGKSEWSDMEYSGYSIPGLYPLYSLTPVEIANEEYRLGHLVVRKDENNQPFAYRMGIGVGLDNILGDYYDFVNWRDDLETKSCRLYQEANSPFPWIEGSEIVGEINPLDDHTAGDTPYIIMSGKASNFANANICQLGSGSPIDNDFAQDIDCECHYTKVNYGAETLYFPYDYDYIPETIDVTYADEYSQTLHIKDKTEYLGWKGFCLENDKEIINNTQALSDNTEHRCLSWYPVDVISGEIDAFAMTPEADIAFAYQIPDNANLCMISEDWTVPENRLYCGNFTKAKDHNGNSISTPYGEICTVLIRVPAGTKVNIDKIFEYPFLMGLSSGDNLGWLTDGEYSYIENDPEVGNDIITVLNPYSGNTPADNVCMGTTFCDSGPFPNMFTWDDFSYVNSNDNDCSLMGGECSFFGINSGTEPIKELFDASSIVGGMQLFYYDEGVNANGDVDFKYRETTSGVNRKWQGGSHIRAQSYVSDGWDKFCEDGLCGNETCSQNFVDYYCHNNNKHLIWRECQNDGACNLSDNYDKCKIYCNPYKYNYYVNTVFEDNEECSNTNCSSGDCGTVSPGEEGCKGEQCLIDKNDAYFLILSDYGGQGAFNLQGCKGGDIYSDEDCEFVACIDNVSHPSGYCEEYLENVVSAPPLTNPNDCITLAQIGVDGSILLSTGLYEDAFGSTTPASPPIIVEHPCLESNEGVNCSGSAVYEDSIVGDDCEGDNSCVKTCQTCAELDDAIYQSNNFYLNDLNPSDVSSDITIIDNVCDLDGNICPEVYVNYLDDYNSLTKIRVNEVASTTLGVFNGSFETVNFPFSALFFTLDNDPRREMIFRKGNHLSYNYYANMGEALSVARDRLDEVVVKIPNENFYEYNENWVPPQGWSGSYWDSTNIDNPPIIYQVLYDSITGFYEGGDGISIDNTYGEHIRGQEGNLDVNLRFYAYADKNRTPIQEVIIDWTGIEADELVLKGPFKNHKHDCVRQCGTTYRDAFLTACDINNPCENGYECILGKCVKTCLDDGDCNTESNEQCFAKTWGDTEDACVEDIRGSVEADGFFTFSYIYTCSALSDYWVQNCQEYDPSILGGCCIYTPSVTIIDNWGNESINGNLGACANNKPCSVIIVPR